MYWDFEVMTDEEFEDFKNEQVKGVAEEERQRIIQSVDCIKEWARTYKLTKVLEVERTNAEYKDEEIIHCIIGEENHNPEWFDEWGEKFRHTNRIKKKYLNVKFQNDKNETYDERLGEILNHFKELELSRRKEKEEEIKSEYSTAYCMLSGLSNKAFWEAINYGVPNANNDKNREDAKAIWKEVHKEIEYFEFYDADWDNFLNSGAMGYRAKLKYVIMK